MCRLEMWVGRALPATGPAALTDEELPAGDNQCAKVHTHHLLPDAALMSLRRDSPNRLGDSTQPQQNRMCSGTQAEGSEEYRLSAVIVVSAKHKSQAPEGNGLSWSKKKD